MSDWQQFCSNFNRLQDSAKQFPANCDRSVSVKSTGEILQLVSDISTLKGTLDNGGNTYITNNQAALSISVQEKVFSFCCIMNARKEAEERLATAKEDYAVAQQRIATIRDPPSQISYFGTRVPFGRPLRPDSVPVLLAISIALVIVSLGMILNLSSIQLAYKAPPGGGPSVFDMLYVSYQQTSWMLLAGTVVLSVAAASGIYYGILKTKPEWLGVKPL